jgi:hypothetical protein
MLKQQPAAAAAAAKYATYQRLLSKASHRE